MTYLSPFFRSPLTDITGGMISHQMLGRCGPQEIAFMDCLEAYGWDRGVRKSACLALMEDFKECQTLRKQFLRFSAMRKERERQIWSGQLQGDKKYVSPPVDSF